MKKNNQSFYCENCSQLVEPHPKSSRDHCNKCLYSKHIDIIPGDRENKCCGLLKPIGIKLTPKKQIKYLCNKCNEPRYCVIAPDDSIEEIIKLSTLVFN